MGGFLGLGRLAAGSTLDAGKFGEHGGEGAFATVADVRVAGQRDLILIEFGEDTDQQGEPGHRPVDFLCGVFANFLRGQANRWVGHDGLSIGGEYVMFVDSWRVTNSALWSALV